MQYPFRPGYGIKFPNFLKDIEKKKQSDKSMKIRKKGKRTSWRSRKHW